MADKDAAYPHGGVVKDDTAYHHGGGAKDNAAYHRGGMADNNAGLCHGGTADVNTAYRSGCAAEHELVVALPPLALPSCPLVVPPSCCAGWLLCGLRLILPPSSNATATGLYCPLQLPPPLPLPSGHHRGQVHCCPLPKKEATAAPPPSAYQRQH
jgi:hypothetical protein